MTSIICNIVISAKTVDVIFSLSIYDYFAKVAIVQTYLLTHAGKSIHPYKIEFRVRFN